MNRKHQFRPTSAAAAILLAAGLLLAAVSGCDSGRRASAAATSQPPAPLQIDTVRVISRRLDMTVNLPGELQPYEEVRVFPRVSGFVQWIGVDRGSKVKKGQLLAILTAPEIVAQKAAAQSAVLSADNQRVAAEAKLAADEATWQRLKAASATPGAISEDELETAEKAAQADRARAVALRNTAEAARANLHAAEEMAGYLRIYAPFDGVVTRRNVHPGALVGPETGSSTEHSMMRIEEVAHLRLVVAVPEADVAGIEPGAKVSFTVPAFPSRTFTGTIARVADSIDVSTRTMPVEADVWNPSLELSSGMFPQVAWPVHRPTPSFFVPQSAVARSAEQAYLLRVRNGKLEQVNVTTGASVGNATEVFGDLQAGDDVALHPTDDMHPGTEVQPQEKSVTM
jgi:membrane fusion protein (multidrug efflux system)